MVVELYHKFKSKITGKSDRPQSAYVQPPSGNFQQRTFDGEKFLGGFGSTEEFLEDYVALRARSSALFLSNPYAAGIIKRLVTHEINTGFSLACSPKKTILDMNDDEVEDWCEGMEDHFEVWQWAPKLCDYKREKSFGAILCDIRTESIIDGDILVVSRVNASGLPCIQTISASSISTPVDKWADGNVFDGVELDASGAQVAFYIMQKDGTHKRLPAYTTSGRKLAWMVYGGAKRLNRTRGVPLLSAILQSLKEIDKYRDSAQRKALISSLLTIFIKRSADSIPTRPMSGGAVLKDTVTVTSDTGTQREVGVAGMSPGMIIENLAVGEEPVGFDNKGTELNFPEFERCILSGIAWQLEVPPAKLMSQYSSNYSASQAELNDFKTYLTKMRTFFSQECCQPFYEEVFLSLVNQGKIVAKGFREAKYDPTQYEVYYAWVCAEWVGAIQPTMNTLQTTKAYIEQINSGLVSRKQACMELNGSNARSNLRQLKRDASIQAEIQKIMTEAESGNKNEVPVNG